MDPVREKLVTDNMNLVHFLAKKFLNTGMEYDDIVSAGYVGLVKAAEQFDEGRGFAFSTFAGRCITNEMLLEARRIRKWKRLKTISIEERVYGNDDGDELKLADMLPCEETGYRSVEDADWRRGLEQTGRLSEKERKALLLWMAGWRQIDITKVTRHSQSYVSRMIRNSARKLYELNLIGGG